VTVRRRSARRQAELDALPVVRVVSSDRTPVRPADESFREFVRRLPCVVCLQPTLGGDPCHLRTKRVSGDWLELDGELVGNMFPGCRTHHGEQHDRGVKTFASTHALDLHAVCVVIGRAYQLGWSAEGLGVAALADRGYAGVDVELVLDGEMPF